MYRQEKHFGPCVRVSVARTAAHLQQPTTHFVSVNNTTYLNVLSDCYSLNCLTPLLSEPGRVSFLQVDLSVNSFAVAAKLMCLSCFSLRESKRGGGAYSTAVSLRGALSLLILFHLPF